MLSVHGYFEAIPVLGRTDTGGQVVYVLELAKHLAKKGIHVDIYTRLFDGMKRIERVAPGVRIIRIPCGGSDFIEKEKLYPFLPEFIDNMEAYIREEDLDYDFFHSHYWDAGFVAMKLAERSGKRFLHTSHSLGAIKKKQMLDNPENERKFRFTLRIGSEKKIFEAANSIIATTLTEKDDYVAEYGIDGDKVKVIPPGVDTVRFSPGDCKEARSVLDVPAKYLLFSLSRIDPRKGLDLLISAVGEAMRIERDIMLIIGGGSKDMGEEERNELAKLKQLAEGLGISRNVVFTGYLPDEIVSTYYRASDIFIIPSRYEPFGLTILEAMAVGTPVIATKHGGPIHIITHGSDGFLVDPENKREFSRFIIELLQDSHLCKRISTNGLATVSKKYSWDSVAGAYLEHVDIVIGE